MALKLERWNSAEQLDEIAMKETDNKSARKLNIERKVFFQPINQYQTKTIVYMLSSDSFLNRK